jgi:hypothetical protein
MEKSRHDCTKYSTLLICVYYAYYISLHDKIKNMATALNIKRKNIDLPVDTLQKLSIMAVAQGRSLKNFIETILINKANSVSIEVSENPSPSGDPWFDDPENMASVRRGIDDIKAGRCRAYSMNEIRELLGV